jgi:hypothetical protein
MLRGRLRRDTAHAIVHHTIKLLQVIKAIIMPKYTTAQKHRKNARRLALVRYERKGLVGYRTIIACSASGKPCRTAPARLARKLRHIILYANGHVHVILLMASACYMR